MLEKLKTVIVSGFPGIGKSHFTNHMFENYDKLEKNILDSDSSYFSWLDQESKIRHPDFPNNYIEHIKKHIDISDCIFVSSHKIVRNALVQHEIPFTVVYPDVSLKDEYLKRYKKRGSDANFIKMMDENWEKFIEEMEEQEDCYRIVINKENIYLEDILL